jgi:hypothetical protein
MYSLLLTQLLDVKQDDSLLLTSLLDVKQDVTDTELPA